MCQVAAALLGPQARGFALIGQNAGGAGPDGHPVRYGNGIEFWSGARDCPLCQEFWNQLDLAMTVRPMKALGHQ